MNSKTKRPSWVVRGANCVILSCPDGFIPPPPPPLNLPRVTRVRTRKRSLTNQNVPQSKGTLTPVFIDGSLACYDKYYCLITHLERPFPGTMANYFTGSEIPIAFDMNSELDLRFPYFRNYETYDDFRDAVVDWRTKAWQFVSTAAMPQPVISQYHRPALPWLLNESFNVYSDKTLKTFNAKDTPLRPTNYNELMDYVFTDKEIEDQAVETIVRMVKKYKLTKKVEYISFSLNICEQLAKLTPKSEIAYLNGDISPKELKSKGINGIDYHFNVLYKHPEWIEEAHNAKMKVNTWTVDNDKDMQRLIDMKVDYLTTDEPLKAKELTNK